MSQDTQPQAWRVTHLPPRERAEALVAAMTLEQKISQLLGCRRAYPDWLLRTRPATATVRWS